jgi:CelD/BcsL family acetyltransferase involved in cellulose biosynthesis
VTSQRGASAFSSNRKTLTPALMAETVHGLSKLHHLRPEFDELAQRCSLPATASTTWVFTTLAVTESTTPWAILVRDEQGTLRGALVLIDQPDNQVRLAGTDEGHRGAIAAEGTDVAELLAEELGQALRSRPAYTTVVLGPLDARDVATQIFSAALPSSTLMQDDSIPIVFKDTEVLTHYLSQGMRRTVRKAHNRLSKDGRKWSVDFTPSAREIQELLPKLERCHRDRDHAHGRASDLDDDYTRLLWQARIEALATNGQLELATLSIDGLFAAHALGILDRPTYRILEGRFVTEWARYSPGRLLESVILERTLQDTAYTHLDWMTAVAPDKLLATNEADPMVLVCIQSPRD